MLPASRCLLSLVMFFSACACLVAAEPAERGFVSRLIGRLVSDIQQKCTSGGFLSSILRVFDPSCGSSTSTTEGSSNLRQPGIVMTPLGSVRGKGLLEGSTYVLPYAKSERWQLSTITPAWTDTLDGTKMPPSCPQPDSFVASFDMSEDCLHLVVYQPAAVNRGEIGNIPVMVWVHGGSFVAGSASAPGLNGRKYANENGVIVVVIQYRLGVLGLLPPASTPVGTPNLALADVINALTFIKSIIASFGGDPKRITVAGQSSGAHMIRGLLASPKAAGLIQNAILQSDPMSFGMSTPATTRLLAGSFYSALNARQGQEMSFDALKALDWRLLVAAQAQFSPSAFLLDNAIPVAEPIRPTASSSDPYLPSDFNVALAAGKLPSWALSVPLLLTTVADESASTDGQLNPAPVPAPYFEIELAQFIGETTKVDAILHSSAYALGTGEDAVRDALNKLGTEGFWTCATRAVASLWASRGGKVYVGEFQHGVAYPDNAEIDYCSGGKVCHQDDIFQVFGTIPSGNETPANKALSKEVVSRWGTFCSKGVPRYYADSKKVWNLYHSEADVYALGGGMIKRTCPANFWGQNAALFDWQMYSA